MSLSLLGLLALVALASCSSDSDSFEPRQEPVVEDLQPIRFTSGLEEEQSVTRDGESLSEHETSFRVWAHKDMSYDGGTAVYSGHQTVIEGYTVNWHAGSAATTTSNSDNWEYVGEAAEQTIKYWDWGAKAYRFFAVTRWDSEKSEAPYETHKAYGAPESYNTYGTHGASGVYTYQAYRLSMLADATSEKERTATPFFSRLWFSTGDPERFADKQFGKPVRLEFLKPYARVRFIFRYVFPREGIKLSGVSFKPTADDDVVPPATPQGIARKGTVSIHYPLTGTATQEWYTIVPVTTDSIPAFTEDYDPENDAKVYTQSDNGWYMVLPNNTQGSYKLSATVNGDTRTAEVPAEYMQWLPGYSYTYIFKIVDEGGIEIGWVETAVTPWTEMVADRTVYNW